MNTSAPDWPLLVSLQQRSLQAQDTAELGFLIANETWHLVPFRQAFVFTHDLFGKARLKTVTGLATLQGDTPYTLWLERVAHLMNDTFTATGPQRFGAAMLAKDLREGWLEWWPEHALFAPLSLPGGGKAGQRLGFVVYLRDTPWDDSEVQLLTLLHETYAQTLALFQRQTPTLLERLSALRQNRRRYRVAVGILVLALFFPVRLSTLAPAEIVAQQAEAIAAPMDGILKTFHVPPNAAVRAGQILFSLDDTTLRNRREVALKTLSIAQADALSAQQKAFDSLQSKAELAALTGRVREKEAEVAYLDELLTKVDIRARQDGIVVYGDPNDWIGKPVVTGERVVQLAQPNDLGVLVWLPVNDAIALEEGTLIRLYLQVTPLSALTARLTQTSYQASISPEGIAAYRIRGVLQDSSKDARIGLRGMAKLYGDWRPLIYWMLRRPLGSLRQWFGI